MSKEKTFVLLALAAVVLIKPQTRGNLWQGIGQAFSDAKDTIKNAGAKLGASLPGAGGPGVVFNGGMPESGRPDGTAGDQSTGQYGPAGFYEGASASELGWN